MKYVYRTAGLVRGTHPYGFVVDDLKKDDSDHLYQWVGMLNGGVWKAAVADLPANEVALGYREGDPALNSAVVQPAIEPQPGEPLLVVCALGLKESGDLRFPCSMFKPPMVPWIRKALLNIMTGWLSISARDRSR